MAFCQEHSKGEKNPIFAPLRETTSIPHASSPQRGFHNGKSSIPLSTVRISLPILTNHAPPISGELTIYTTCTIHQARNIFLVLSKRQSNTPTTCPSLNYFPTWKIQPDRLYSCIVEIVSKETAAASVGN